MTDRDAVWFQDSSERPAQTVPLTRAQVRKLLAEGAECRREFEARWRRGQREALERIEGRSRAR